MLLGMASRQRGFGNVARSAAEVEVFRLEWPELGLGGGIHKSIDLDKTCPNYLEVQNSKKNMTRVGLEPTPLSRPGIILRLTLTWRHNHFDMSMVEKANLLGHSHSAILPVK